MGAVAVGLLAGAVADRVAGDPRRGHPVAAFGSVAAALERRAWRPTRTVGAAHVLALAAASPGWRRWPTGGCGGDRPRGRCWWQ
jgi:adenosylcobinamide-phosphate synthase